MNLKIYLFLIAATLLFAGCNFNSKQKPKTEVGIWDKYEQSFPNEKEYSNPYFDVDLTVELESPSGEKFTHCGFYDGDQNWKIRFMPNKTGTWKYTAQFSDSDNKVLGSFECVDSELKGTLSAFKENPIWFATENGEPFLIRSFHVGDRFFAENWVDSLHPENSPRTVFLEWLEENNYNMLSIASFFTNRQSKGRGLGWDTPKTWPLNCKEFQKAEAILDELHRREIYVFPFAGFFGRDGNWPTNQAEQEKYIKYILARWSAYYNLNFNVAGPEPLPEKEPVPNDGYKGQMKMEDIERLAALIKKYDVSSHLITEHNRTWSSQRGDPFRDKNWYDFSTIQGPKTPDLKHHERTVYKIRHSKKPYYAQETLWGGNMYHPKYGVTNIRKIGVVLTMNAAMINFADNDGNSSSGFSGSLNLTDCQQNKHDELKVVWDFFETIPFAEMKPDTIIAPEKFVLAGKKQILIYAEKQDSFQVNLDGRKVSRAEWINTQNPSEIIKMEELDYTVPILTPNHGDDWYLRVFLNE